MRDYISSYAAERNAAASHALIPAWTRKYNMNCSGCHYPAAPRLNATGIRFRSAGYRMPEEMGEKTDVNQLSDYISLRGRMRNDYSKTENQPASNSFTSSDVTLFYAGPLGQRFAAFIELEREPSGEVGLVSNILGIWGKENRYGGFRAGQMHWLQRDGVAGFERPTGIRTPTPFGGRITNNFELLGGFAWGKDQDLPVATPDIKGMGYWVSGQYMFAKSWLTVFGRYEFVDPNTDVTDNGTKRLVLGGVVPVGLPEYLRFALEGALDMPQASTAPKRTGLTAELMLNF